jgi:hypothetical protein
VGTPVFLSAPVPSATSPKVTNKGILTLFRDTRANVPPPGALSALAAQLEGELHWDTTLRRVYATDASEYQELPAAVALPRSEDDLRTLLAFAREHRVGLVPRTAGTSLAGQVVGPGIVIDVGRHLNRIIALDVAGRRVRVQPGVVRNELNLYLWPHGLFFAPETSTASRAMIGGMVGNNSCGANSIVYGSTRDHLISTRGFLSDGSETTFGPLTAADFAAKCAGPDTLETRIYRTVHALLGDRPRCFAPILPRCRSRSTPPSSRCGTGRVRSS